MRYTLRSPDVLKWVMDHPGRGTPYSIRDLADEIGLPHHSLIGHLLKGVRKECDMDVAHRIAEAVGVAVLVLFAPAASPDPNGASTRQKSPHP